MTQDIRAYIKQVGKAARAASRTIAAAPTGQKSAALQAIGVAVEALRDEIKTANALDMGNASERGIDQPLIDRLLLDDRDIDQMIEGLLQVDALQDPVGEVTDLSYRPSGIQVGKMRVPLGVIAMIYESRPNVTVDAAALSLKSGNACILRGGSEAFYSNQVIAEAISRGLSEAGLPEGCVHWIETTDRDAVGEILKLNDCVDVIVPRGGKSLIERISRETTITVIKHLDGICHAYIDAEAEAQMAVDIAVNSKTEKFAVCNAIETLLVHRDRAEELLPTLAERFQEAGVELRGCERSRGVVPMLEATEADWYEEYLGPILAVKIVDDFAGAVDHINRYGSQHTETIVTSNYQRGREFMAQVDSSSVMINASTQFADGFEYGLGAEVGISTDKIHARGPVGLQGLTSQKYVVFGNGEVRHR